MAGQDMTTALARLSDDLSLKERQEGQEQVDIPLAVHLLAVSTHMVVVSRCLRRLFALQAQCLSLKKIGATWFSHADTFRRHVFPRLQITIYNLERFTVQVEGDIDRLLEGGDRPFFSLATREELKENQSEARECRRDLDALHCALRELRDGEMERLRVSQRLEASTREEQYRSSRRVSNTLLAVAGVSAGVLACAVPVGVAGVLATCGAAEGAAAAAASFGLGGVAFGSTGVLTTYPTYRIMQNRALAAREERALMEEFSDELTVMTTGIEELCKSLGAVCEIFDRITGSYMSNVMSLAREVTEGRGQHSPTRSDSHTELLTRLRFWVRKINDRVESICAQLPTTKVCLEKLKAEEGAFLEDWERERNAQFVRQIEEMHLHEVEMQKVGL
ncbi:unnamed protein product [Vitrella brassicaformis CCMP3155]|uniref:Uncharacterized protein n=1 Tax=Vitrella brassicaformis (strain CCMP3155) TaxID=1169540 RepID=A0A0G4GEH7_VITBC|nr:unnamed protein product [Vitrella brassicaformis CCMP3155]|eukprot:CEM27551.1 unnamed protein product [Vitrella brassicaformis CCMP3155]